MLLERTLKYDNISLKNIFEENCTEIYVNWLNDKKVNTFLTSFWIPQTLQSVTEFVKQANESSNNLLLGIFYDNIHIGNIKLGPIDTINNNAYIGYFIGNKDYWNKGIATKSVKLLCQYAFNHLNLHKIYAGVRANNFASQSVLKKCGFIQEGLLRKSALYLTKNNYVDAYIFGIFKEELK